MIVMKRHLLMCLAFAIGCSDSGPGTFGITPSLHHGAGDQGEAAADHGIQWIWSEPVNLGSLINSDASDTNPSMSPDELSLYFVSQRTGGQGAADIWVSRRASVGEPWGAPVNLGTVINTAGAEAGPTLSDDGHLFFFHSDRAGGHGDLDLYVSYRANVNDDFGWGQPVNLGPLVNTASQEAGAEFVNAGVLVFNRRQAPGATPPYDIFIVSIGAGGIPTGTPVPISELNTAAFSDFGAEVSDHEREVLFGSNRPGLGSNDLWRSTRRTKHDAWSAPENLGPAINSIANDRHPSLSNHGRTLIFASARPGGVGSDDLWMSTRRPGAQSNRED